MNRTVAALVFGGGLAWAAGVPAVASQEPSASAQLTPILSGPVVDPTPPPVPVPDARKPAPVAPNAVPNPAPIPERGPLLVIPGVNTPRAGMRVSRPPAPNATAATERPGVTLSAPLREDPPTQLAPLESAAPAPYQGPRGGIGSVRGRDPGFSDSVPPRILDSEPIGLEHPGDSEDSSPKSRTSRKPVIERKPEAPRRTPGIFGRMFPVPAETRGGVNLHDSATADSRTDPAADAAVKRRIEKSIRENLGDKLRFYEVRVVGREIKVRARAARFWQKRTVKNSLEALPGLKGYKVVIDMAD